MFDAIVVAGGSARRLGGVDKPAVQVGGRSLLDHVVDAVGGAARVIVVGPERRTETDVVWAREQPPGGGPVAAIAAGLAQVQAAVVLVLAADLPVIAPAVPLLLDALDEADVAVLAGNPLAAAWRTEALRAALRRLDTVENAAARWLLRGAHMVDVADADGWGTDCDNWDDVARARARVGP